MGCHPNRPEHRLHSPLAARGPEIKGNRDKWGSCGGQTPELPWGKLLQEDVEKNMGSIGFPFEKWSLVGSPLCKRLQEALNSSGSEDGKSRCEFTSPWIPALRRGTFHKLQVYNIFIVNIGYRFFWQVLLTACAHLINSLFGVTTLLLKSIANWSAWGLSKIPYTGSTKTQGLTS